MAIMVLTTTSLSRHLKPDICKEIRSCLDLEWHSSDNSSREMADKSFDLTVLNEKKGEASTREFSQGAIAVLLGALSHSIHCTPALYLLVLPVIYAVVLEDFQLGSYLSFTRA